LFALLMLDHYTYHKTEHADKIRISTNVLIIQYLQQTFPTFSYITRGHTLEVLILGYSKP